MGAPGFLSLSARFFHLSSSGTWCQSLRNCDSDPVCGMAQKEREAMRALLAFAEEPEVEVGCGCFPGLGGGGHRGPASHNIPRRGLPVSFLCRAVLGCPLPPLGCRGSAGISRSRRIAPELTRGPSPQLGVNKLALKVTSSGSGSSGPEEAAIIFQGCKCQRGTH